MPDITVIEVQVEAAPTVVEVVVPGQQGPSGDITWEGPWLTATAYLESQAVEHDGSSYVCIEAHTSGTFATDLAADKWELMAAAGTGADGEPGSSDVVGTSTSSVAIGTGTKTFTIVEDDRGWGVGARLRVSSDADGGDFMEGVVTAYSVNTLEVNVDLVGGSGTHADWTINLAGSVGGADAVSLAAAFHAAAGKTTPVDADEFAMVDSAASNVLKKLTWANLKATVAAYLISAGWIRDKLTANRIYYVRTDGNNTNTGLADSAGGAFLTIQKAIDTVAALDISTFNVTIQVRDGTYTSGASVSGAWLGSGTVFLVGNTGTPANCVIGTTSANCIVVSNFGRLTVLGGFKLQTTTSGIGAAGTAGGVLSITGPMEYGACATAQIYAERGGVLISSGAYTISGGAPRHVHALSDGYVLTSGAVTLTGTPAFTAFARGERMALLESACIYTGAATGARYSALTGGGVNSFGGGASFFPGDAVGTATSPGWYA